MKLRGIEFGKVQNASGARGFYGETSNFKWHQKTEEADWHQSTFVTKTITLHPHKGNLPVAKDGITPLQGISDTIVINKRRKAVLNAIGLTGPGIRAILKTKHWQRWPQPFFISFMAVGPDKESRLQETRAFASILQKAQLDFVAPFALQVNFSCPNTELDLSELQEEIEESLTLLTTLQVPLIPKLNLLVSISRMLAIAQTPYCDALYLSNTLPWGESSAIPWATLFGQTSPLAKYGGGGLSGKPLYPLLLNTVRQLTDLGITKPILAGGGISSVADAETLLHAGAAAISLGSVSIYEPSQVQIIIRALQSESR